MHFADRNKYLLISTGIFAVTLVGTITLFDNLENHKPVCGTDICGYANLLPYLYLAKGVLSSILVSIAAYYILHYRQRLKLLDLKTAELGDSEERYRRMVDGIQDCAIYMLTPEGDVKSWNKGAERIEGYRAEEIIGTHFSIFYSPKDVADGVPGNALKKARLEGRYISNGVRYRNDGTPFYANLLIEPVWSVDKKLLGYAKITRDVSEAKMREQMLENQAALLQLAHDAIFVRDLSDHIVFWNKGAELTYGWKEEEVLGRVTHEILKTVFPKPLREIQDELELQDQWHGELVHTRKDGRKIAVTSRWAVKRDPDGLRAGTLEINRDITESKRSEKKLEEARRFQRLVFDSNPDMVFIKDQDFKFVDANPSLLSMFPDKRIDEVIGHTRTEEFDSEEAERFLAKDQEAFDTGRSEVTEPLTMPNGHRRVFNTIKVRFVDNDNVPFILGISRDVTDRQQLVDKLLESNTELERFAYVASHDMQEPLRMISGISDIIMKDYADKLDEEGKEYLGVLRESSERIRAMVRDLLDYAKIDKTDTSFVPVDANLELVRAVENLSELVQESGAEVLATPLVPFQGNPIQFMRLLQNLITNGIKYQAKGHKPIIRVSAEERSTEILMCVEDNGLGINKEFLAKVFEPFRRLHGWDHVKGTGLGLAVCKKIVENHGGQIWIESVPGQGSKFWFTLAKKNES